MDRESRNRRSVVSVRMSPRMLEALGRIAQARPYGWQRVPTPRTMLIEEALTEYAGKHDEEFRAWHDSVTGRYRGSKR